MGSMWRILALSLILVSVPAIVRSESTESPVRVGFLPLGSLSNAYDLSTVEVFRQGLREAGLVENRHVIVDLDCVANESEYSAAVSVDNINALSAEQGNRLRALSAGTRTRLSVPWTELDWVGTAGSNHGPDLNQRPFGYEPRQGLQPHGTLPSAPKQTARAHAPSRG